MAGDYFDFTLPSIGAGLGALHPLTRVMKDICDVFTSFGFSAAFGPEAETDAYNFEALNFPENHPARDMQDTFFLNADTVLRTHTSPVQIRTMLEKKPPIRIIAPGRVFRCDADTTHSPVFHQVEGLVVDRVSTLADLKALLLEFSRRIFGDESKIRFRPSFFPFTEPSVEVDVFFQKGPNTGSWMEILGAGMVDPSVLTHVGIDPDEFQGYAFGLGVERVAMLKYGIHDIRLFYENAFPFMEQFR